MTDTTCVICSRPVPDTAYACTGCGSTIARHLAEIADLAPAARAVAAGQTRRGPAVGGHGGGGGLPLNLAAGERIGRVQNAITGWARIVLEERGRLGAPPLPAAERDADPLVTAARWLANHLEWLRHWPDPDHPEDRWPVLEFSRDAAGAARVLRGIADGPGARRWLGQCGAPGDDGPCRLDLAARPGAATARCRCGASVVVADRLAELAEMVRGYAYTASEIAEAYPEIRASTIRVWAHRGRIAQCGEIAGRPTYDLGEVLDRARAELVRRAERQARVAVVDHGGTQGVTSGCNGTTRGSAA